MNWDFVATFSILKSGTNRRLWDRTVTNDLCTSFTKNVIILFLNKAVFILKNNVVISIFCAKNRTTV